MVRCSIVTLSFQTIQQLPLKSLKLRLPVAVSFQNNIHTFSWLQGSPAGYKCEVGSPWLLLQRQLLLLLHSQVIRVLGSVCRTSLLFLETLGGPEDLLLSAPHIRKRERKLKLPVAKKTSIFSYKFT